MQHAPITRGSDAPVIELRELEGRPLRAALAIHELLWGEKAVLVEVRAPAGFDAEPHFHDHESLVYFLSGRVRATVGAETWELRAGDAVLHPAGIEHHIEALVDTRWIEIKIPARATWPTRGPSSDE